MSNIKMSVNEIRTKRIISKIKEISLCSYKMATGNSFNVYQVSENLKCDENGNIDECL